MVRQRGLHAWTLRPLYAKLNSLNVAFKTLTLTSKFVLEGMDYSFTNQVSI